MDGVGRATDNIFIERLWRSLKYELIYLNEFDSVQHVKQEISGYFHFFNQDRGHQTFNYLTPDQVYSGEIFKKAA